MSILSRMGFVSIAVLGLAWTGPAQALTCSNNSNGFEGWKQEFAQVAKAKGVGGRALQALAQASYSRETIRADRGQKSFKYTLEKFMKVRGAAAIVSQGRKHKARHAAMFADLERAYGVPAGPLIAIWGMETGFGRFMGDTHLVSATATLAFDCRRSEFFTGHLIAALRLVDVGILSAETMGAKHGEVGQTQFLPGNVLAFGADGDRDGRVDLFSTVDALASTANFLRAKGWRPGQGYQPGEPNFVVIQEWNAASVYQQAIALIGRDIDG